MERQLSAFPNYPLQVRDEGGKPFVLDPIRRKWVRLTPEENVRQHLLHALADSGFPTGLTAVEKAFEAFGRTWRADVAVFDRHQQAMLLAECKAPEVAIDQSVFDQLARYNAVIGANILLATNGNQLLVAAVEDDQLRFLNHLPSYASLISD